MAVGSKNGAVGGVALELAGTLPVEVEMEGEVVEIELELEPAEGIGCVGIVEKSDCCCIGNVERNLYLVSGENSMPNQ
jgi:hypothetical protein